MGKSAVPKIMTGSAVMYVLAVIFPCVHRAVLGGSCNAVLMGGTGTRKLSRQTRGMGEGRDGSGNERGFPGHNGRKPWDWSVPAFMDSELCREFVNRFIA